MKKETLYILMVVALLLNGCSATKRSASTTTSHSTLEGTHTLENITNTSFDISRFTLNINLEDRYNHFIGFVKHRNQNQYLISIRNLLGIEYARGLIDANNSVTIVIRPMKIVVPTTIYEIKTISGIDLSMISLLFGKEYNSFSSTLPYNIQIEYNKFLTIDNYQYPAEVLIYNNNFAANILYQNVSLDSSDELAFPINNNFKIVTFAELWNNILLNNQ